MVILLLACATAEPPVEPVDPVVVEPTEASAEAPAETPATAVPAGIIGGAPILERPVILGGIANEAVEAALDLGAIQACNTAGRPGKVLLKFSLDATGTVTTVSTTSTTLRHESTETCMHEVVQGTAFPALERGEMARVTWPFTL
jgi:hypothetical protein